MLGNFKEKWMFENSHGCDEIVPYKIGNPPRDMEVRSKFFLFEGKRGCNLLLGQHCTQTKIKSTQWVIRIFKTPNLDCKNQFTNSKEDSDDVFLQNLITY